MAYKLMITPAAEEQFDNLIYYLRYELQNQTAAENLISQTKKYIRVWKKILTNFRYVIIPY